MRFWKIIFFPFSWLYGLIMEIRNGCYSSGIFHSYKILGKSITIGNLSMGGTGKSPHTLYVWQLLKDEFPVSFLSRGYGRTTTGLIEVKKNNTADEVGDEPLMFKKRVSDTSCVVVSENRKNGIDYLREKSEDAVILLDDAFQHRKVQAGYSILLTDYSKPYYNDFVVPMGTLRECRKGRYRADCVIVTKCPNTLEEQTKQEIIQKLKVGNKPVFFSSIAYDPIKSFTNTQKSDFKKVLLVTGIANPTPILEHLSGIYEVELIRFKDHHNFEVKDLALIHEKFGTFVGNGDGIIVTTEKDFVRLSHPSFEELIKDYPWYYQPITINIDKEEQFITEIRKYVRAI